MFTEENNQEDILDKNREVMVAMMVGTGVEFQNIVIKLVQEYKNKGIEEIKISVLEEALAQSALENMGPKGLLGTMIKKGEIVCK